MRLTGSFNTNRINGYPAFYELGVDGAFSDFADNAFAARAMFLLKHDPNFAACLVSGRRCEKANH